MNLINRRTQKPVHHIEYSPSFLREEAEEQNEKFKTETVTPKQLRRAVVIVVISATITALLFMAFGKAVIDAVLKSLGL